MTFVSIIIPCYNEQATIRLLLDAIYHQTYPRSDMEVIIADGFSTDQTRQEIAKFQHAYPALAVRIVDNHKRTIPSGLNRALEASRGDIIIRLDAHSTPALTYVERCVAGLQAGLGENVGGVWDIQPGSHRWISVVIAAAAAHPLGVGDALYRLNSQPGEVDTVPFGAYRRETFERVGRWDENLLTNEDYELNTRIRQSGGKIWLDPAIRSIYFARPTLSALARQYWRYGFWKWRMLRRYPKTLRPRQALPPLFVLSLIILAVLSFFCTQAAWVLLLEICLYLAILIAGSISTARQRGDWRLAFGVPLAIATMHISWGSGFLASMLTSPGQRSDLPSAKEN